MKILVMADQVHKAGGIERTLAYKTAAWCRAGHTVEIVTIENEGRPPFYDFSDAVEWLDLNIRYDRSRTLLSPKNMWQAIRHCLKLRIAMARSKPDIILHCGYGYDFYFVPVLGRGRSFLVKENHSSRFVAPIGETRLSMLKRRLRRYVDEMYHVSVFLSPEEAKLANTRNSVVIPNPIPPITSTQTSREKVVIAAGRICGHKGFDRLVRAWALITPRIPDWKLEIYGDGDAADVMYLRRLVLDLQVGNTVEIIPARRDIIDRMANCGIFALPSRTECFPMVLLEAMQVGLPIVAFDCPTGPRNILDNRRTGVLVPDDDIAGFAVALRELMTNESLRDQLSSSGMREAARYQMDSIEKLWARLFSGAGSRD